MIQGYFCERRQLFFEIELITADGLNLPIDALFDPGFTGFMALNIQDLDSPQWDYIDK